jgi:hypothetical protein
MRRKNIAALARSMLVNRSQITLMRKYRHLKHYGQPVNLLGLRWYDATTIEGNKCNFSFQLIDYETRLRVLDPYLFILQHLKITLPIYRCALYVAFTNRETATDIVGDRD